MPNVSRASSKLQLKENLFQKNSKAFCILRQRIRNVSNCLEINMLENRLFSPLFFFRIKGSICNMPLALRSHVTNASFQQ